MIAVTESADIKVSCHAKVVSSRRAGVGGTQWLVPANIFPIRQMRTCGIAISWEIQDLCFYPGRIYATDSGSCKHC